MLVSLGTSLEGARGAKREMYMKVFAEQGATQECQLLGFVTQLKFFATQSTRVD